MTPDEPTYPCPAIALIALAEVQRRHQAELTEVLQAARAASDLSDGVYTLDVQKGEWVPRLPE